MQGYSSRQASGSWYTVVDVVVREVDTMTLDTLVIGVLTHYDPRMQEVTSEALEIAVAQVREERTGDEVLGAIVRPIPAKGLLVEVSI